MPRYKRSQSTIDSPFSTWHRRQHDGVNMTDIDVVGICPACAAPLFIADTIYNIDFRFKGKDWWHQRPYKVLAEGSDIPYYEIFYTVDESTRLREIIRFDINKPAASSAPVFIRFPEDRRAIDVSMLLFAA